VGGSGFARHDAGRHPVSVLVESTSGTRPSCFVRPGAVSSSARNQEWPTQHPLLFHQSASKVGTGYLAMDGCLVWWVFEVWYVCFVCLCGLGLGCFCLSFGCVVVDLCFGDVFDGWCFGGLFFCYGSSWFLSVVGGIVVCVLVLFLFFLGLWLCVLYVSLWMVFVGFFLVFLLLLASFF